MGFAKEHSKIVIFSSGRKPTASLSFLSISLLRRKQTRQEPLGAGNPHLHNALLGEIIHDSQGGKRKKKR